MRWSGLLSDGLAMTGGLKLASLAHKSLRHAGPMHKIAMIGRRGGTGKTTLSVLLSAAAAFAGHRSVITDLDPMKGATHWYNHRQAHTPLAVGLTVLTKAPLAENWADDPEWNRLSKQEEAATSISLLINEAQAKKADFVVMDTATNDDLTSVAAASAADVVLIPCRVGSPDIDLDELDTTLSLVRTLRKPIYVIPNAVSARGLNKETSEKLAKLGAWVAPHYLTNRAAFAIGIDDWAQLETHDAGKEIQALYAWLCDVLGMPPCGNASKAA
jgi:chromosome partitioning protein